MFSFDCVSTARDNNSITYLNFKEMRKKKANALYVPARFVSKRQLRVSNAIISVCALDSSHASNIEVRFCQMAKCQTRYGLDIIQHFELFWCDDNCYQRLFYQPTTGFVGGEFSIKFKAYNWTSLIFLMELLCLWLCWTTRREKGWDIETVKGWSPALVPVSLAKFTFVRQSPINSLIRC